MVGVVVPLLSRTVISTSNVVAPGFVRTTVLRWLPVYSWKYLTLQGGCWANSLTASDQVKLDLVESAATDEEPDADFLGVSICSVSFVFNSLVGGMQIASNGSTQLPPFADLVIEQRKLTTGSSGSVTCAASLVMRGRSFDRIERRVDEWVKEAVARGDRAGPPKEVPALRPGPRAKVTFGV